MVTPNLTKLINSQGSFTPDYPMIMLNYIKGNNGDLIDDFLRNSWLAEYRQTTVAAPELVVYKAKIASDLGMSPTELDAIYYAAQKEYTANIAELLSKVFPPPPAKSNFKTIYIIGALGAVVLYLFGKTRR